MDRGTHLVFLVRHGKAMDRQDFQKEYKLEDRFRPLTDEGVKSFASVAKKFHRKVKKKLDLKKKDLELVFSPYTRAHQTAQIIEEELAIKGHPYAELEHHKGGVKLVEFVAGKVLAKSNHKAFILVGHEPELTTFYKEIAKKDIATFKKGEIRCLKYSRKKGYFKVEWRLLPNRKA